MSILRPRPPQGSAPTIKAPPPKRSAHSDTQRAYDWRCGPRHARVGEEPDNPGPRPPLWPRPSTCRVPRPAGPRWSGDGGKGVTLHPGPQDSCPKAAFSNSLNSKTLKAKAGL